jgi:putative ABC transport system ATP-binding protein
MTTLVSFSGVSFGYGRDRTAVLENVDWQLPMDESVAVLRGPSGCGKTTVLMLAGGLVTPTQGTIVTLGVDLASAGEGGRREFRRRHVAFVYQDFRLIEDLTASENVGLPLWLVGVSGQAAANRVRDALAAVGMDWAAARFPDQLSGGEQQRVGLARALVTEPTLILADEPTANLDDASAATVASLIVAVVAERSCKVLIASHDPRVQSIAQAHYDVSRTSIAPVPLGHPAQPGTGP